MRGACRTVTIQRNDKSKRVRRCGGSKNRQLVAGQEQPGSNILHAILQARTWPVNRCALTCKGD